jgi:hypothetical protein
VIAPERTKAQDRTRERGHSALWRPVARHGRRRWALLLRRGAMMPRPATRSDRHDYDGLRFCAAPHGLRYSWYASMVCESMQLYSTHTLDTADLCRPSITDMWMHPGPSGDQATGLPTAALGTGSPFTVQKYGGVPPATSRVSGISSEPLRASWMRAPLEERRFVVGRSSRQRS